MTIMTRKCYECKLLTSAESHGSRCSRSSCQFKRSLVEQASGYFGYMAAIAYRTRQFNLNGGNCWNSTDLLGRVMAMFACNMDITIRTVD